MAPRDPHVELERRLSELVNLERSRSFHFGRVRFDLRRMETLCERLGHPQHRPPALRVAGSKGKGSVAILTGALLAAHGLRVGLHTSPHLHAVEERIAIDGCPIAAATLCERLARVLEAAGSDPPTYFEAVTLAALLAFAEEADVAVHECGIGARLDATNVVPASVAVLTGVEVEHAHVLGRTRREIAADKAHVAGPGSTLVTGIGRDDGVFEVVEARCRAVGATWVAPPDLGTIEQVRALPFGLEVCARVGRFGRRTWRLGIWGRHQAGNLLLALAAADRMLARLGREPDPAAAQEALSGVTLPGRLEPFAGDPPLVVDGAHTSGSVAAALEGLRLHLPGREPYVVLGMARDKDVEAIAPQLRGVAGVVATTYPGGRAFDAGELAGRLRAAGVPAEAWEDPEKALARAVARAERREGAVLVTGSLWLAGWARARLGRAEVRLWST